MKKLNDNGIGLVAALLIIFATLIVAAAAAFGTYSWQHGKVNDLNDKIGSLNTRLSSQNSQISTLTTQLNKACQNSQSTGTTPAPVCAGYNYTSANGVNVMVFAPAKNTTLTSPVAVVGEVPGSWSFEAQFPVLLKNSQGATVAQATARLVGDWMTDQLVPFYVQLTYSSKQSGGGTLVLQKDNPSGLAKNSDSVTIPIKF